MLSNKELKNFVLVLCFTNDFGDRSFVVDCLGALRTDEGITLPVRLRRGSPRLVSPFRPFLFSRVGRADAVVKVSFDGELARRAAKQREF